MFPDQLPVYLTDGWRSIAVRALVEQIPSHAHDVLRATTSLCQYSEHVGERLADLSGQLIGLETTLFVPADLAGDEDNAALCRDAVGVAARAGPAGRLKNLHCHLLH